MNKEEHTLNKTNGRSYTFLGTQIAFATDRHDRSTRWTNVFVYQRNLGGYVVGIGKLTTWTDTERDTLLYEKVKSRRDAVAYVNQHAPHLAEIIEIELNPKKQEQLMCERD